ncbi:MAG TPA: TlpA disulfide reductase family protein, partial [Tepidisphaeraceae bacterium]|nr:TlpA disulfide reductase family protein [Tepidisphaeraceae bacterium]
IGTEEHFGDYYPEAYRITFPDGFSNPPPAATFTNSRGEAFVPPLAFDPIKTRFGKSLASSLFVLDESRNLAAVDEIQRSEFDSTTTHVVTLEPACKVTGHVTCYGLGAPGGQIQNTYAYVYTPGKFSLRGMDSRSKKGTFEFLLPHGDYCIQVYGGAMNTYITPRYVRIRPGERRIDLTIDLCPTVGATLRGKPAPELTEIKEWKNSPPLTLAGLHGKVVLLDFWGIWCGECMAEMKQLIALNEQFKDRGLVIIGVHDASVQSMSAISASLARAKDQLWGGKEISFPIALDSGGEEQISGTTLTTRGKTTATYGVESFPTTLLIGRDGKVIKVVDVTRPQFKGELQKLLDENPRNGG